MWRDDEVFTDQRLAGLNPMAIQRVSWDPGNQAIIDNVTRLPLMAVPNSSSLAGTAKNVSMSRSKQDGNCELSSK